MKIHHLNCGTMCPWGCHWLPQLSTAPMVCHCWLIETKTHLILVDTGFGTSDLKNPTQLGPSARLFGWDRNPQQTALAQITRLGFKATDVREIVLTHLDLDHAGGIADFPEAIIHLLEPELSAAQQRRGLMNKIRYRPAHFSHNPKWQVHPVATGEAWMGFQGVREVKTWPPELLLAPLIGHTAGHLGVIAKTSSEKWLFHVGDSYYSRDELDSKRSLSLGYRYLRLTAHHNRSMALQNQQRLSQLVHTQTPIELCSSHDLRELAAHAPTPNL